MSRFFQSRDLSFDNSFMYQPPWELAKQAVATNDAGIDQTLQTASLFNNIDIQHIPDPVERELMERELKPFQDKAKQFSTDIQLKLQNSPQSWKKYMPQLQSLGTDLSQNMKNGNLAKIQQSAAALAQWQEENKKIKEENPELYNTGLSYYLQEWKANPNRSLDKTFQGDKIINFDPNNEKFQKALENFKNSKDKRTVLQGAYIKEIEGVDSQEVENAYHDLIMSDPNAIPYLRQMAKFKVPGFYNPVTGKPMEHFMYTSGNNKPISEQEFSKEAIDYLNLTDDQKAYTIPPRRDFNPAFAWTGSIKAQGSILGSKSETIKENPVVAKELDRRHDFSIASYKHGLSMALEREKQSGRKALADMAAKAVKNPAGKDGKEYADKATGAIVKNLANSPNSDIDYKKGFESGNLRAELSKGNPNAKTALNAATVKAMEKLGYTPGNKNTVKMPRLDARAKTLLDYYDSRGVKKDEAMQNTISKLKEEGWLKDDLTRVYGEQISRTTYTGKGFSDNSLQGDATNFLDKIKSYHDEKWNILEGQNTVQMRTHGMGLSGRGTEILNGIINNTAEGRIVYRLKSNGAKVKEDEIESDFSSSHIMPAYEGGSFSGTTGVLGQMKVNGKMEEVIAAGTDPTTIDLTVLDNSEIYMDDIDYRALKLAYKDSEAVNLERLSAQAANGNNYTFDYYSKNRNITGPIRVQVEIDNEGKRQYYVNGIDRPVETIYQLADGISGIEERVLNYKK